ncbi:MAG: glycine cleavage system aminomethyltransferase GcvT [Fimbriimonadales bacterium]|nr:glycine cleavage system aminomethyltransferase GcvT [Fimbriimonadales bacterium]
MSSGCLRTPLFDRHVALGARIVPFAGYEMPVQYDSVIAESKAVREAVGMFDVSHMARLWLRGERALGFLEWMTANDVSKLADGKGQYSLLPNERGGTVDDIIVYRISPNAFRMVVNAANHTKDVEWLQAHNDRGVEIEDETDRTAMIAVQGPKALATLAALSDQPERFSTSALFDVLDARIAGVDCFAPRSGYTGEEGCELVCAAEDAGRLWDALLQAGVKPCGLGARDVLRVEAGLPLYGHELADDLSPIAAGLGWVISKTKEFLGCEPIRRAREEGTPTKLQGLRMAGRRLPTVGAKVFVQGREVGEVSSGVFSPTLDCGIAFAFVDASIPLDTPCEVELRGKREPATIVSKRFLRKRG